MQPTFVVIPYEVDLPYSVERAYAWLTDFQDDDHAIAGAIVHRRIVKSRAGNTLTLEGEVGLLGGAAKGVAQVVLSPPDRWTSTIVEGAGKGSVYEYRLTPTKSGCHLRVDYRVRVKRWKSRLKVVLARPFAKREIRKMWDGFLAAMARDLAAAPAR